MNVQTPVQAATLIDALAVALPQLEAAKKGNVNPHFKSKYADLGSVIDAIRPVAEHGIWFTQVSHENERGAMIETFFIGHGEKISAGTLFVPADKTNAQGFGSALTYARRYGLQTAFGLSTEDDDGNAASAAPRAAERQSEGSASSSQRPPDTTKGWREEGSPFSTPTKLHNELKRLERELFGCGDTDMVYGLTATDEWKEFVRVSEKHMPHYLRGGDPAPEEFEGLLNIAERMVREFDSGTANQKADLART